jgi:hypothetical protein
VRFQHSIACLPKAIHHPTQAGEYPKRARSVGYAKSDAMDWYLVESALKGILFASIAIKLGTVGEGASQQSSRAHAKKLMQPHALLQERCSKISSNLLCLHPAA